MFWNRLLKKKPDFKILDESYLKITEPDRFIVVKHDPEEGWTEIGRLDRFPQSAGSIDLAGLRAGDRVRIYDAKNPEKLLRSYTIPGKISESRSERKSAISELGENVDKIADEVTTLTSALGKLNQALVVPSGITKEDLKMLIEELRQPQANDFKTQLKSVVEVLSEFKEADKTIKSLAGGENSEVPEKILEKMDGWPLMLYYPPSRTIKELKEAGKEMLEHAIKTAKGELTGQEDYLAQVQGESILDKYRKRKMQKQGG